MAEIFDIKTGKLWPSLKINDGIWNVEGTFNGSFDEIVKYVEKGILGKKISKKFISETLIDFLLNYSVNNDIGLLGFEEFKFMFQYINWEIQINFMNFNEKSLSFRYIEFLNGKTLNFKVCFNIKKVLEGEAKFGPILSENIARKPIFTINCELGEKIDNLVREFKLNLRFASGDEYFTFDVTHEDILSSNPFKNINFPILLLIFDKNPTNLLFEKKSLFHRLFKSKKKDDEIKFHRYTLSISEIKD